MVIHNFYGIISYARENSNSFFVYRYCFPQDKIELLRNEINEINISFLNSKLAGENKFSEFVNLLNSFYADEKSKFETAEVIAEFEIFLDSLNQVKNFDSLRKTFSAVNNKFNSLCYNYFYQILLNSSKQKILVFPTSSYCECTLDMCYRQQTEVQKFCKGNNFDYSVIDNWKDFQIQQKYNVDFVPTIIILDPDNKEIHSFKREGSVEPELNRYFLENQNGNNI